MMSVKHAKKRVDSTNSISGSNAAHYGKPGTGNSTIIEPDIDLADPSVVAEDEIAWDKSFAITSQEDIEDLERGVLARTSRKRVRPLDFDGR